MFIELLLKCSQTLIFPRDGKFLKDINDLLEVLVSDAN